MHASTLHVAATGRYKLCGSATVRSMPDDWAGRKGPQLPHAGRGLCLMLQRACPGLAKASPGTLCGVLHPVQVAYHTTHLFEVHACVACHALPSQWPAAAMLLLGWAASCCVASDMSQQLGMSAERAGHDRALVPAIPAANNSWPAAAPFVALQDCTSVTNCPAPKLSSSTIVLGSNVAPTGERCCVSACAAHAVRGAPQRGWQSCMCRRHLGACMPPAC